MCRLILCNGDHGATGGFIGALIVSVPVVILQTAWRVTVAVAPWVVIAAVHTARYLHADVRALVHLARLAAPVAAARVRAWSAEPAPPAVNRGLAITAAPHGHVLWSTVNKELSR